MKHRIVVMAMSVAGLLGLAGGCQQQSAKAPDVKDAIRGALDQAGYRDVSVSQDRDKAVVTLTGTVRNDADKVQAESIARSIATGEVVANQIGVRPAGDESAAKEIDSALDKGIEKNLEAALIQHKLKKDVKYEVKNGVVTLTGDVNSPAKRSTVEKVASEVPNVRQVVNEIEVKNQKASASR
jgi:hyperosmotically inducible periplasmic protein